MNNKVIDISKKTFINVVIILSFLILLSILLTYIIPNGVFKTTIDSAGNSIIDYTSFEKLEGFKGINILKGIFSPILVLFTGDGLTIIMLSLFICVIGGSFQVMNDTNGMKVIVEKLIKKFKSNKKLLISIVVLIFMIFGSFFGLFEEVLTLLPIIILLSLSLGYDSYLGFLMCVIATGFGFASALTNPFTVLTASTIIGASPIANIWYRALVFLVMYGLLLVYIFRHIKKISKNPELSPTYEKDLIKKQNIEENVEIKNSQKIFNTYVIFLSIVFISIMVFTSIPALRDYTVVGLIAVFLIGGLIAGLIAEQEESKKVFRSFLRGVLSALPAVLLVLMASSVKYILEEGKIIATIVNSISTIMAGKHPYIVVILIYIIILVLEFFISSSTAKAVFVMGILSCVSLDLSKETMVLAFLFGDGYTNVLFPTSPVLLIGLSMTGMSYLSWIKKSKFLFLIVLLLVIMFLCGAVMIGY